MESKKPHSVPLNYHLHTCPAEDWPNSANKSRAAPAQRRAFRARRLFKQDIRAVSARRCEFEHKAVKQLLLYDNNSPVFPVFSPYLGERKIENARWSIRKRNSEDRATINGRLTGVFQGHGRAG